MHSLWGASCLNQELVCNSALIKTYLPFVQWGHRGAWPSQSNREGFLYKADRAVLKTE